MRNNNNLLIDNYLVEQDTFGYSTANYISNQIIKEFLKDENDLLLKKIITEILMATLGGSHSHSIDELVKITQVSVKKIKELISHYPSIFITLDKSLNSKKGLLSFSQLFVVEQENVYLTRYWKAQQEIFHKLEGIKVFFQSQSTESQMNKEKLLNEDLQTILKIVMNDGFVIVTGQAGSGKSWTALQIVQLFAMHDKQNIVMCAPTGKAVTRLSNDLEKSLKDIEVKTIHSLLGKSVKGFSYYDKNRLLPYSLIVIDETSMVEWELFAELMQAVSQNSRLIIVGDPHQLNPIGVSGILSKVQNQFESQHVHLQSQQRFSENSEIHYLAELAKSEKLLGTKLNPPHDLQADKEKQDAMLSKWLENYIYPVYQQNSKVTEVNYKKLLNNVILSPWRQSKAGVKNLNKNIQKHLHQQGYVSEKYEHCEGLPIVVRQNYNFIGVYNGDRGVLVNHQNQLKIAIKDQIYTFKQLTQIEIAFAMTIHQTQGSEFDNVFLWLGDIDAKVKQWLSSNLLYTSITRCKKDLLICGNDNQG